MKCKIPSVKFRDYLRKLNLNGTVDECLLLFDKTGVKTKLKNMTNTIIIMSFLKQEAFEEYEELGLIGVGQLGRLINLLGRFKTTIILEKINNNTLRISDDLKNLEITLLEERYINTHIRKVPSLDYEGSTFFIKDLKDDLLRDWKILESSKLILKCKDNKLNIDMSTENTKLEFNYDIDYKDVEIWLGLPIRDVLEVITEPTLQLSFETDHPLVINEINNDWSMKYIIAPLGREDEK